MRLSMRIRRRDRTAPRRRTRPESTRRTRAPSSASRSRRSEPRRPSSARVPHGDRPCRPSVRHRTGRPPVRWNRTRSAAVQRRGRNRNRQSAVRRSRRTNIAVGLGTRSIARVNTPWFSNSTLERGSRLNRYGTRSRPVTADARLSGETGVSSSVHYGRPCRTTCRPAARRSMVRVAPSGHVTTISVAAASVPRPKVRSSSFSPR